MRHLYLVRSAKHHLDQWNLAEINQVVLSIYWTFRHNYLSTEIVGDKKNVCITLDVVVLIAYIVEVWCNSGAFLFMFVWKI